MIDIVIMNIIRNVLKDKNESNSYIALSQHHINKELELMTLKDMISYMNELDIWYDTIEVHSITSVAEVMENTLNAYLLDRVIDEVEKVL